MDLIKKNRNHLAYLAWVISIMTFLAGIRTREFNIQIIGIYLFFLGVILVEKKNSLFVVIFIVTFFIFLVNRPMISALNGKQWWLDQQWPEDFNFETLTLSLTIIYLSLFCIFLGHLLFNFYTSKKMLKPNKNTKLRKKTSEIIHDINQIISKNQKKISFSLLLGYLITLVFNLYIETDKLIFMQGKNYEEYYLLYSPSYSLIIKMFGRANEFFMFAILALNPPKIAVYVILTIQIALTIPSLIIGQRGPLVISLLFSFVYFFMRNLETPEKKWIGKFEKTLIVVGVPLLLVLLSYINDTRHGSNFDVSQLPRILTTFLYKQGVTFNTFLFGVHYKPVIYSLTGSKNYLLGDAINVIKNNPFSRGIIGTSSPFMGNSVNKAINGYWYSHILAYVSHPRYLEGFGYGTSYLIEAYHTYGVVGVILTNIFLGWLLTLIYDVYNDGFISNTIILSIIFRIFYLPRQPMLSFISFLYKPYFWFFVLLFLLITSCLGFFYKEQFNEKD